MTNRWMSRGLLLAAVVMTSAACTSLPKTPRTGADAGDGGAASMDGGSGVPDVRSASGDAAATSADGGSGVPDTKPASRDGVGASEGAVDIDAGTLPGGTTVDLALPTVDTAPDPVPAVDANQELADTKGNSRPEDAPLVTSTDGGPAALDLAGGNDGPMPSAPDAPDQDSPIGSPCGPRDCRSSADRNCNGVPDNSEPECACPIANQSAACQAAQPGVCAVGTKLCTFALDNTTSAWSACLPGTPRSRDCTSTADNNCDGTPDNNETDCICPSSTATKSCSTGLAGICATGTATCKVAADKTSSQWGDCVAPSPRTRDCTSSNDNNCDGTPDKSESSCALCGETAPRVCNTHPGYDGIGTCSAGAQAVVMAADKSECHWGDCTGDQGPSAGELCGVAAPDLNCDGIPGNGNCALTIKIYSSSQSVSCGCSDLRSYSTFSAGTSGSGSVLSQFKVFTGPRPASTAALCTGGGSVTIGSDCSAGKTLVGYVSTVQGNGYLPLTYTSSTMACGAGTTYSTPLGPGKTSTTLSYYVLP